MSDDAFEFNDYGLAGLLKLIEGEETPKVKVGILGEDADRDGSGSNADIGRKHEYGLDGMEKRSFLRMPLIDKMQEGFNNSEALDREVLKKTLNDDPKQWLKKIGLMAEAIVADAFSTGGFGSWKKSEMKYKKNHQTLVETQQLRNSITSVITEDE